MVANGLSGCVTVTDRLRHLLLEQRQGAAVAAEHVANPLPPAKRVPVILLQPLHDQFGYSLGHPHDVGWVTACRRRSTKSATRCCRPASNDRCQNIIGDGLKKHPWVRACRLPHETRLRPVVENTSRNRSILNVAHQERSQLKPESSCPAWRSFSERPAELTAGVERSCLAHQL
jgi:hypothetical protein